MSIFGNNAVQILCALTVTGSLTFVFNKEIRGVIGGLNTGNAAVSAPATESESVINPAQEPGIDMNRVFIPKFNIDGDRVSQVYTQKVREGVRECGNLFLKKKPNRHYQIQVDKKNFIGTITVPTFGANREVVGQKSYPLYTKGFKCTSK